MNFSSVDVIWTLLGAALVYFMQAGFAMCEAGLTRAKNTGNILMKNMMDFSSVLFQPGVSSFSRPFSVQHLPQLFLVPWQREQISRLTAYTVP